MLQHTVLQNNSEEALIQNLKDAGCSEELIKQFQEYCRLGKEQEGIRLLGRHRDTLLDAMHREQKRIDCLDYLLYQMKKEKASEQFIQR